MHTTEQFWEKRYADGGNSGSGSYGELAVFKANVINHLISNNSLNSIIELGSGDGNQLSYFNIDNYIGIDISPTVIELCREKFKSDKSKSFFTYSEYNHTGNVDLTLSLDVIYHILDDVEYKKYMFNLFSFSNKYVVIYSNNYRENIINHMYSKYFTKDVSDWFPNWTLDNMIKQKYPSKSSADFFIYKKL